MTFQDVLNKMTADAKKHNMSLVELCAKNLHNKKSPVKLYLTKLGKQPAAGTIPLAMQAGECIYNELGNDKNKLMALLAVNPSNVPNSYKNFGFYDLMCSSPSAFLSVLAIYEESPAVSKFDGKNAVISSAVMGSNKVSYASGDPNAIDYGVSGWLSSYGIPVSPSTVHKIGDFVGKLKDKIGKGGEQAQALDGGWIEYWKYMVGGPMYGQTPKSTPVSLGYWRGNAYPIIYKDAKEAGLNPPAVPAKDNAIQIAEAQTFNLALNELFIKYYDQVKDMTNGWPNVYRKLAALAQADPSAKQSIASGVTITPMASTPSTTPSTSISAAMPSSNTLLYIGGGLVLLGGIYYFMKGRN